MSERTGKIPPLCSTCKFCKRIGFFHWLLEGMPGGIFGRRNIFVCHRIEVAIDPVDGDVSWHSPGLCRDARSTGACGWRGHNWEAAR